MAPPPSRRCEVRTVPGLIDDPAIPRANGPFGLPVSGVGSGGGPRGAKRVGPIPSAMARRDRKPCNHLRLGQDSASTRPWPGFRPITWRSPGESSGGGCCGFSHDGDGLGGHDPACALARQRPNSGPGRPAKAAPPGFSVIICRMPTSGPMSMSRGGLGRVNATTSCTGHSGWSWWKRSIGRGR